MFEDKRKERGIASKPLINMNSTQTSFKQCNETSSWFWLSPNLLCTQLILFMQSARILENIKYSLAQSFHASKLTYQKSQLKNTQVSLWEHLCIRNSCMIALSVDQSCINTTTTFKLDASAPQSESNVVYLISCHLHPASEMCCINIAQLHDFPHF